MILRYVRSCALPAQRNLSFRGPTPAISVAWRDELNVSWRWTNMTVYLTSIGFKIQANNNPMRQVDLTKPKTQEKNSKL